ncbi:uncharacterized protein LOC132272963 [Cornus florida]|uniref:uncharacterized protein LOC132272963 n=1 Tax=Cornus florida TaxID=4283 RepID=UPI00289C0FD3|nr:uncharacterized protein LOC132272963 [Cornus florida]
MLEFMQCLHSNELEDLRYNGIFFSWSNNSLGCANVSRKLDRVLINQAWMNMFPQAECNFLPHRISDHSPMVVRIRITSLKRNLPFRFFNFWTLNPKFVAQGWQLEVIGTKMYCVVKRLRALKLPLRLLNINDFGAISKRVEEYRSELYQCQQSLDCNPADDQLRVVEKELAAKFSTLCLAEEIFYKQKAQIHWLKDGDQNTSYFMKVFSSKANRRKVLSLEDPNGEVLQSQES